LAKIVSERAKPDFPAYISLDVPTGLRENAGSIFIPPGNPQLNEERKHGFPAPDMILSFGASKAATSLNEFLAAFSEEMVLPIGFHPKALFGMSAFIPTNVFNGKTSGENKEPSEIQDKPKRNSYKKNLFLFQASSGV